MNQQLEVGRAERAERNAGIAPDLAAQLFPRSASRTWELRLVARGRRSGFPLVPVVDVLATYRDGGGVV